MRQAVRGAVSGLAATVVFTALSARLKAARLTVDSVQPVEVAEAVTGAAAGPDDPRRRRVNQALHWGYGTWGGLLRVVLMRAGLRGWRLDLAQLAAFWLPWRLLALAKRSDHQPPRRDRAVALLLDLGKHAVYVVTDRTVHGVLDGRRR